VTSPPRPLAQKLIIPLTLLVAVIAGVSGMVRVAAVERGLRETMILGADQLSRGITSATWHAMLDDNRSAAYDVMQAIARQQGISRIRIYNKEGRIMFSTAPEAGRVVDKNAEACALCHASARPLVNVDAGSRARVFRGPDGMRRLAMITPIFNEPSCSNAACHAHPASQQVLGVLDVAMDLSTADRELRSVTLRILFTTVLEILLISAFLVFFLHHFVTRPMRGLVDATGAVSRMQLDRPIEIDSSRELAELARSFDVMREKLREAMVEINRSSQDLEAKVVERTEQLRQAQQRLMQSDRLASLGQLAASVAHEINNPLSGVLNFSALMQRIIREDGIPPGRVGEFRGYLDHVAEQTARAGRIVSDLLAFSRRSKPQRAPADLNTIVRTTAALVGHKLKLMNVEFELRLADDLPPLPCDASQIQEVVLNLVMNGAESTRGRGAGRVTVATRRTEGRDAVLLEVADDGEGMAKATVEQIFDPFFTTKDEGKGVGLGLAVVYGIVQSHGGEIDVKSTVGAGTTFEVVLPLAAEGGNHVHEPGPAIGA
jgi:two-component system NtrC family sensor kinase